MVLTLYSSTAGMFKLPIFSPWTALGARSQACVWRLNLQRKRCPLL